MTGGPGGLKREEQMDPMSQAQTEAASSGAQSTQSSLRPNTKGIVHRHRRSEIPHRMDQSSKSWLGALRKADFEEIWTAGFTSSL